MIAYQSATLANGLNVLVHEDPNTTLAVMDIIYDVGSRDEDPNLTGFAHLFEHLMFGGSKHIPSFDAPLQRVGGENNAFTTPDLTNYYISLPAENLETAFWLESDRMLSLAFDPQSLEVQRKVVIEEFKQRYLNQPYGDVWLKLRPLAYQAHPYRWATIGADISHIEQAQMEDVTSFFHTHYVPQNAHLVVAGKVRFEEVMALAKKWFEPIPGGRKPQRQLPKEPVQKENRRLEHRAQVPADVLYLAWHTPGRYEPGYHAMDAMADLLGRGESSFLYERLVRQSKAFDSVAAYLTGSMDTGLLVIQAQLAEGQSMEAAEALMWKTLKDFVHEGLDARGLQKIKNQNESTLVFMEVEVLNKAMNLAMAANAGHPDYVNQEAEKIQAVSLDEVQAWARHFFLEAKHNTLLYLKSE